MRIDNPTADQIKPGDVLSFYTLIVGGVTGTDCRYGMPRVAYLEREDKLEAGDEFKTDAIFRCTALAIAEGHVLVRYGDGSFGCEELKLLLRERFEITKKHND